MILTLKYDENKDLKDYLLPEAEQYDHLVDVYGKVINFKDVKRKQGIQICVLLQQFIRRSLHDLQQILLFDDPVLNKIYALDPQTTTQQDLLELGGLFPNIIPSVI